MRITFIIGGARSGKSSFALKDTSKIKGLKAYIATAEALDDEMKERIEKHKIERGHEWDTFEEPLKISSLLSDIKDRFDVILLDCLTLWLSNILARGQMTEDTSQKHVSGVVQGSTDYKTQTAENGIQKFIDDLQKLKKRTRNPKPETRFFIVSNEVGAGIVPENKLARQFRDLAGTLNQKVAEIADEVYLVTAGIPVKIKD
jgi:adenosylcobinamide kinase/adenosylcobinamide-phosphate guanylyltransferase